MLAEQREKFCVGGLAALSADGKTEQFALRLQIAVQPGAFNHAADAAFYGGRRGVLLFCQQLYRVFPWRHLLTFYKIFCFLRDYYTIPK